MNKIIVIDRGMALQCFLIPLFFLFYGCNQQSEQGKLPNIILININDMGWRDLGFMGSESEVSINTNIAN